MDKRIAIGIMAALLLLVVTAAYAPNPGAGTALEERGVTKKLDTILENQQKIMDELESLREAQETIQTDIKWIRSRS